MATRFFDNRLAEEWIGFTILKWLTIALLVVHVSTATAGGYRAIVQVYDVDIELESSAIRPGSPVAVRLVTSGRNFVDARLELVQAGRVDTLETLQVRSNGVASMDPRPRRAVLETSIPADIFARSTPGPALLRAVAEGRSQWLRVPPPEVRERAINLTR
jgi:hypothetical protein